jgi:amino acid permease
LVIWFSFNKILTIIIIIIIIITTTTIIKHMGKSLFIKTHCTVDCNNAKNGHCSPRIIALWITQFVGALCAAAPGTDTWRKDSPFLATKVPRLQGGGVAP